MNKRLSIIVCLFALVILANQSLCSEADVAVQAARPAIALGAPFSDNAVLQRDMPVPVWGWAEPGSKITVAFAGQTKVATADKERKWLVTLDPMKACDEPRTMTITSSIGNPSSPKGSQLRSGSYDGQAAGTSQQSAISNVLVGEVWICSGQSNMQYGWGKESHPMFNWGVETNLAILVADARKKPIRSFTVLPDASFVPKENCQGAWVKDVSGSAVAFGFSYDLYQKLNVPVGVIVTCWGSSSIEGWMPRELTEQLPHFKAIMQAFDANTNVHNRVQAAIDKGIQHKNVFVRQQPNLLYNAMLHPVIPYACRGMVWYQGEANAGKPAEYAQSLPAWIKRLRAEWEHDDFRFLIVMLPGYGDKMWPWFREVQLGILQTPHTSVANTIDLGEEKNIHPADKAPICERLALLARRDVYGEKIEAQGPVFKSATVKGNRVAVEFDHAADLKTTDGAAPVGFMLAGNDRKWLPAKASIKGSTVELEAEGLTEPVFIRYAFAGKPIVNLVNGANLPAYPFRTDNGGQ